MAEGACVAGGYVWQAGMHGRDLHGGVCMVGAYVVVVGDMCGGGGGICGGVHGRGLRMVVGSIHGRGCAWQQGACVAGGMCAGEMATEAAVRILLECILVHRCFKVLLN